MAYRVLGSLSEADDAVQEAWLRLSRSDTSEVENLNGWLTTVVARLCLDVLRSRKSRREETMDRDTPKPIVSHAEGSDPEQEALLADSVGAPLLVVLDTLTPAERLAYVLHDMFDISLQRATVDGAAGLVWATGGRPRVVSRFTIPGGRIVAIDLVAAPERLRKLDLVVLND